MRDARVLKRLIVWKYSRFIAHLIFLSLLKVFVYNCDVCQDYIRYLEKEEEEQKKLQKVCFSDFHRVCLHVFSCPRHDPFIIGGH